MSSTVIDYPLQALPKRLRPHDELLGDVGPEFAEILRVIERAHPGTLDAINASPSRPTLIRACARLIDPSHTQRSGQHSKYPTLVQGIIETVDPKQHELTRLSITAPKGRDDQATMMTAARDILARVSAEGGACAGGILARDRRAKDGDNDHHLYGVLVAGRDSRSTIRSACTELLGSGSGSVKQKTIVGWERYASCGDPDSLRTHLGRVTNYMLHDLPRGEVRDLDVDVVASGVLAAPWHAFRDSERHVTRLPPRERLQAIGIIRSTACAVCGGTLEHVRADARYCAKRCRLKARIRSKPRTSSP